MGVVGCGTPATGPGRSISHPASSGGSTDTSYSWHQMQDIRIWLLKQAVYSSQQILRQRQRLWRLFWWTQALHSWVLYFIAIDTQKLKIKCPADICQTIIYTSYYNTTLYLLLFSLRQPSLLKIVWLFLCYITGKSELLGTVRFAKDKDNLFLFCWHVTHTQKYRVFRI